MRELAERTVRRIYMECGCTRALPTFERQSSRSSRSDNATETSSQSLAGGFEVSYAQINPWA
jgi:hypothetical protein